MRNLGFFQKKNGGLPPLTGPTESFLKSVSMVLSQPTSGSVTAVVNFPWPGNGQQVQLWDVIRSPNNSLLGFIVWCLLHLPPEGAKKVETAYFNFFIFLLQVYTSFKKIAWLCWWLVEVKVSSVNVLFSKISFSYRFC